MAWFNLDDEGFDPSTALSIQRVLDASSDASAQVPTGLGVANKVQVTFGPAQGTISDPVMLAANGDVTINKTGVYLFTTALQVSRSGASGTSIVLFRVTGNNVQAGRTVQFKLSSADVNQVFENNAKAILPAGTVLRYEMMRDSEGSNFGGLTGFTPTVDGGNEWDITPAAAIRIERYVQG